ncbi:MAG: DUF3667 domain-containing protein [Betaproteobacteria bacterium]|nr:MAG: DUF3667 domain-containing protein [Betaproteobacteria bacterium]TMH05737.1 MAG: DUF3667 domain-containing protein [Betaproteobacteria bacterium]
MEAEGGELKVDRRCRNCGALAGAAYCPECGQETHLRLPTLREFLREAAGRYVALDGRFWRTLIALSFRPGWLTREYFAGRRRRYVRPARLFLVLSIALFALLRFTGEPPKLVDQDAAKSKRNETTVFNTDEPGGTALRFDPDLNLYLDAGAGRWVDPVRRQIDVFNRLPRQDKADQIFAGVLRYGPYAMFALLPLFALLVELAYAGRARRYPARPRRYAAHLVFGAHNHAFLFLIVALIVLIPVVAVRDALALWAIVYLLRSMKNVYGGRWSGVLARAVIISLAYLAAFIVAISALLAAAILLR